MYIKKLLASRGINLKKTYCNFIGGEWREPIDKQYYPGETPITGEVLYHAPRSTSADVEHALEIAEQAFLHWSRVTVSERAHKLMAIAEVIEKNALVLAMIESIDSGKILREVLHRDIPAAAEHFRYFAACITTQEVAVCEEKKYSSWHVRSGLGVVAQIIPWNYPLLLVSWKMAPALAAGNCVIIKPAEQTPLSLLLLADLLKEILPKGVFNVLVGLGEEVGKPLASHPSIAKVAFTGSLSTGRKVLRYTAENITPTTVELGGKSPNIIFADVFNHGHDYLNQVLEGLLSFTFNQGQTCGCLARALIHESIYERLITLLLSKIKHIKSGDPFNSINKMGPQISADHLQSILNKITEGIAAGASCLYGGKRNILPGELATGFYMIPTVLVGKNEMKVFQEEIFGPVLCVTSFNDEEQALQIANDSIYGLTAGLWTKDMRVINKFSKNLQCGRIWVNCHSIYPTHAAFGGVKKSGFGKESLRVTLESYQNLKNIITTYE